MVISSIINEILNEQINKEFYSGYLYLSMSAHLKELGLNGFSSWTKIQAKEEVEHGLKIFDYLINCNSFVTLKQIKTPDFEFKGVISIFERIYEHEKSITSSIMSVAKKAEEECDRTTLNFVDWFIEEQIGEEDAVQNIIKRLELFGDNKVALYLMDKELGERK
jgi:ferritin